MGRGKGGRAFARPKGNQPPPWFRSDANYSAGKRQVGPNREVTLLPGGLTRTGTIDIPGLGLVTLNESCVSHQTKQAGKPGMGPCVLREVRLDDKGNYQVKLEPEDKKRRISPSSWPAIGVGLAKLTVLPRPAKKRSRGRTKASELFESRRQAFYDALTKHAEDLVANRLITAFGLSQPLASLDKGALAREVLAELERLNPQTGISHELMMVEEAAASAELVELFRQRFRGQELVRVEDVAFDTKSGRAEDIVCHLSAGDPLPISIKTDKSGKIALSGYGQTSLPKMAVPCYGYEEEDLERLARDRLDMVLEDTEADHEKRALLLKLMLAERLGLEGAVLDVVTGGSEFSAAKVTDLEGAKALFEAVALGLLGKKNADVLVINRMRGTVGWLEAPIMSLPPLALEDLSRISFTPTTGRTIGFKFDGAPLFEHQVHSGRGGVKTRAAAA